MDEGTVFFIVFFLVCIVIIAVTLRAAALHDRDVRAKKKAAADEAAAKKEAREKPYNDWVARIKKEYHFYYDKYPYYIQAPLFEDHWPYTHAETLDEAPAWYVEQERAKWDEFNASQNYPIRVDAPTWEEYLKSEYERQWLRDDDDDYNPGRRLRSSSSLPW